MRKIAIIIFSCSLLLELNSCTKIVPYYKPDIQQGNIITQAEVNKLKKGMTKNEVINTLGTPIVKNAFYTNQLIYVNTNLPNRGQYTEKRLRLEFKHGRLISGEGDFKLPF